MCVKWSIFKQILWRNCRRITIFVIIIIIEKIQIIRNGHIIFLLCIFLVCKTGGSPCVNMLNTGIILWFNMVEVVIMMIIIMTTLMIMMVTTSRRYKTFISVINQLDTKKFCFTVSLFHVSTCFEHHVLIIRGSKLYYTASGIITPIGGRLVTETCRGMK